MSAKIVDMEWLSDKELSVTVESDSKIFRGILEEVENEDDGKDADFREESADEEG